MARLKEFPYFEAVGGGGHVLKVAAPDGVLTGAQFCTNYCLKQFQRSHSFWNDPRYSNKTTLRSVNFTPGTVNTAFPIKVNGTAENITITTTSGFCQ